MAMDPNNTWLGIGAKVSGMAAIYKREFTSGWMFCLGIPTEKLEFRITQSGFGLGLGGGTNLVVVIYFNKSYPPIRQDIEDFSIDLSLGGKWKAAASALSKYQFYRRIAHIGSKLGNLAQHLVTLRQSVKDLYDIYDVLDGKPTMINMNTPVGWGVEVSVAKVSGLFEITDYSSPTTTTRQG